MEQRNAIMLKRNDHDLFDLLGYLEGPTWGQGVFEDRAGYVKRRFTVELAGQTSGDTLTLHENFLFDDGETQARTWELRRGSDQKTFTGTCGDAVSPASGRFEPGKARLTSKLRIPVGSIKTALCFDDVFYDTRARTVLNRSIISKWGFRIGQVMMVLRKP